MRLILNAPNINQVETSLLRFAGELQYPVLQRASREIQQLFFKVEKQLFQNEGSTGDHGSWPDLSDKYKKWKNRHYPGQTIMVLKGGLRNSLTSITAETIFSSEKTATGGKIKLGTDIRSEDGFDYPTHHQTRSKKIRRTIDPKGQDSASFIRILQREILTSAKKTFDKATIIGNAEFDRSVPSA